MQCSHVASVYTYTYIYIYLNFRHTLIVWGWFLRSCPQTTGMRFGGVCTPQCGPLLALYDGAGAKALGKYSDSWLSFSCSIPH